MYSFFFVQLQWFEEIFVLRFFIFFILRRNARNIEKQNEWNNLIWIEDSKLLAHVRIFLFVILKSGFVTVICNYNWNYNFFSASGFLDRWIIFSCVVSSIRFEYFVCYSTSFDIEFKLYIGLHLKIWRNFKLIKICSGIRLNWSQRFRLILSLFGTKLLVLADLFQDHAFYLKTFQKNYSKNCVVPTSSHGLRPHGKCQ